MEEKREEGAIEKRENGILPDAMPARNAAPSADISVCEGLSKLCPVKLLVSSITKSLLQTPPSAL
jgi:hypothetical protein